jgi:carboxypeptidase Q
MKHPFTVVPRVVACRGRMALSFALAVSITMPALAQERVDMTAITKIKDEGFKRSQVMDVMSWLTDVHGPRLTGSPTTKAAGDWAIAKMKEWGVTNPRYEWWDNFGRGWMNERMVAQVTSPVPFPVIAYPTAWSPGTPGPVTTDVVLVPLSATPTAAEYAPYRGKLKGKIVMTAPARELTPLFTAPGSRYDAQRLGCLQTPDAPECARGNRDFGGRGGRGGTPVDSTVRRVALQQCLIDEGVAAILTPGGGNSNGGTVFTNNGLPRTLDAPANVPQVFVAPEHYGRIYRILERKVPVRMELDVKTKFYDSDLRSFNIVGELPGTDKRDEVVMLGAHFDSWHAGTGATDNAAGSAVMMEAMRILKATGLPLRRTVRIGLWTGEEQGLIGSREYVAAHFANRTTMETKPEHAKLSAYYNVDNGTGAIRGIYLQGNQAAEPVFAEFMKALDSDSISVRTIAPGNTGGTDHQSFDAVGLPGFQFIQDPVEYNSRTHHSSQDVYERVQPVDMRHNAVAVR